MTTIVLITLSACSEKPNPLAEAQITQALSDAHEARLMVTQLLAETGRYPAEAEAAALSQSLKQQAYAKVRIEADSGMIWIDFVSSAAKPLRGQSLKLEPSLTPGGLPQWQCKSETIAPIYLPARCRSTNQ